MAVVADNMSRDSTTDSEVKAEIAEADRRFVGGGLMEWLKNLVATVGYLKYCVKMLKCCLNRNKKI